MSSRKFAIGRWAGLLALMFSWASAAANAPVFTPEEQQWIKVHPVVYFAADDGNFPLSYMKGGMYKGLVAEYIAAIAKKTGLHFERYATHTSAENETALLAGRVDAQEADAIRKQALERVDDDAPASRGLPRYGVPTITLSMLGLSLLAFFAWRCWMSRKVAKEPIPTPASKIPAVAQARVLVVEDHPEHRAALIEQLKTLGVASVGLHDGLEALADIERQPPALILMDCHMPGLDGYETTRRIRQREAEQGLPHVPIIAVSAASNAQHLKMCMEAGMDGVLKKPLRPEELLSTLDMWLEPAPQMAHAPVDTPVAAIDIRTLYQTSMDEDIQAAEQSVQSRNAEELAHFAHRMKGAALMLGAHEAADAADRLEQEARSATQFDMARAERLLQVLKEAIARYFAPVDSKR